MKRYPQLFALVVLLLVLLVWIFSDTSHLKQDKEPQEKVTKSESFSSGKVAGNQKQKRHVQDEALKRSPGSFTFFERSDGSLAPFENNDERIRRSILSREAIKIDWKTLQTIRDIGSGFLDINIGEDASITASVGRVIDNWGGGFSLSGQLPFFPMGSFMATVHGDSLVVNVRTGDEKVGDFEILQNPSGQHELRHVDGSALPSCDAAAIPPAAADKDEPQSPSKSSPPGENGTAAVMAGDGPVIDVLVVYTANARISRGGVNGMIASINQTINEGNQALSLSHVSASFRLAHSAEITYTETADSSLDLVRVRGKADGSMDSVHTLRDEYGADIVSLWTQSSYSGVGYLMSNLSGSFESSAFNVCDVDYAVSYYTLIHECGHNMGCHHDVDSAAGSFGLYAYSYGSHWLGSNGNQYRSIMAYPPGTRVLRYSNPSVTFNGGVTGSSSADNARTINNSCLTVSNFRAEVAGAGLALSSSYADIDPDADSYSFNVTSSGTWSWSQSADSDWLTVSEASPQTGNQIFSYSVAENLLPLERTAVITFTQDLVSRSYTIVQKGSVIDDHGNSISAATVISQNSATPGNIGTPGDNDYFRINVTEAGTLVVGTTGQSDTQGYLLDGTGGTLVQGNDAETVNFSLRYDVVPGTYYVRVRLYNGNSIGSYQLVCSLSSAVALTLDSAGRSVPAKGGSFSFEVYSNTSWNWVDDANWVTSSEASNQDGNQVFLFTVEPNTAAGTRAANITFVAGNRTVVYQLSQAGKIADDHGNTSASATLVGQNSSNAGSLETFGDEDFFRINVSGTGVLTVNTTGMTDTYGHLLDAAGNELASNDDGSDMNFLIRRAVTAGTYYVRVRHYSFSSIGVYRLVSSWTAAVEGENLVGWGSNGSSQLNIPSGLSGVVAVATGRSHTLALQGNGKVTAWGSPVGVHTYVPPTLGRVLAVAGGSAHSMALKSDSTVAYWGQVYSSKSFIPIGLKGVVSIASGWYHCLALKSDGNLVVWGENSDSQLKVPAGLKNVMAIAGGAYHSLALKTDGRVVAWGSNNNGQCDVPAWLENVVAISAGENHSVALRADGSVVAWGDPYLSAIPSGLGRVVAISAGASHTLALKKDGTVAAWGYGSSGETVVPATFDKAVGICAGYGVSYAIKEIQGTEPEVHIHAGGNTSAPEILNDGSIQVDFGNLNLVGGRREWAFTIANKGLTALQLGSSGAPRILVAGEHAADFKLTAQPVPVVTSGASTIFKIVFDPSAIGDRSATVRVMTGDLDNSPFVFGIEGSGQDLQKPTIKLTTQAGKVLSTTSPMKVMGTVKDNIGIDRVEISLNGAAAFQATLASPGALETAFTAFVEPVIGSLNTLTVSVYDAAGNMSSVTRTFMFELRYGLTLTREVPAMQALTPDKAGTVALAGIPSKSASALTKGPAPQTSDVLAGTSLRITATAKTGHLFSHWDGLSDGAAVAANVATFTMPAQSVDSVKAVFVVNDIHTLLAGKTTIYQGLLLPEAGTPRNNSTVGFINAGLAPSKGTLSGKIYLQGTVTSFTALIHGDGSVWFRNGKTYANTLDFLGRQMKLFWTGDHMSAELTGSAGMVSSGVMRSARPAGPAMLDAKGKMGYYTLALPAKNQSPGRNADEYPQGTGYGTFTLTDKGAIKMAGMLADGSKITVGTFLTDGDHSDLFVQLLTPGGKTKEGTLLGTLKFDPMLADTDVTASNLIWIRPQVSDESKAPAQIYTAGWAGGIVMDAKGALYNGVATVQNTLALPVADVSNGNARFSLEEGKLPTPITVTQFNITDSKVNKLVPADRTFSLSITAKTGLFNGTFQPSWTHPSSRLPAFQGVMLQKGLSKGGYGFFISNRPLDLDPESGSVRLGFWE